MVSDGLPFLVDLDYNGGSVDDHDQSYKGNMAYMLKMANIPFLMQHSNNIRELNSFLVLKKDEKHLELPLQHDQYISAGLDPHLDSSGVINFKTTIKNIPNFNLEARSLYSSFKKYYSLADSCNTNSHC